MEKNNILKKITYNFKEKNQQLSEEISDRKKAQKELEYSETRLKTILDAVKTCILVIDSHTHEILEVNPEAAKVLGASREKLIGTTCFGTICHAKEGDCPVTDRGVVIYDAERTIICADGKEKPVLKTVTAIKLNGRDCLLENFVDISVHKKTEQQLHQAKDLAEASVQAKNQFLANMSHEIRTPMNAIIGFGSLLLDEELTETQMSYAELIYDSSKNLLSIINDILDFSKIEAGKMTIEKTDCQLRKLLKDLQYLMHPLATDKNLEYSINIAENLPDVIISDPGRLRQCLINLTNNAIKFTQKGHVCINVDIRILDEKKFVCFEVEDTGIGIPEERQSEIFKAFTQADGSTSREYGGTGLGLTITKQFANLLGGDLMLKSTHGKGAVFTLLVPAQIPETNQADIEEKEGKTVENQKAANIALVAEDSHANQTLIKILLQKAGFDSDIAQTGKEAVELAQNNEYDIILMDIHMPEMNGDEAAELIMKSGNKTPIIAMTAESADDSKKYNVAEWSCDSLEKPISREKLSEILSKYTTQKSNA